MDKEKDRKMVLFPVRIDEAVEELRTDEFAAVFEEERKPKATETLVDVDADALIPEAYLSNRIERLNMYRRISECPSTEELTQVADEMADRFGPLPSEVSQLISGVQVKLLGQQLRLPKITFKNARLFLRLASTEEDPWFYERRFHPLLAALGELDHRYVLKESRTGNLRAIIQEVFSLDQALSILEGLTSAVVSETSS